MTKPANPFDQVAALIPDFEDDAEALMTLRQAARVDPLRGCPMNVAAKGENEHLIEPGKWRAENFDHPRTGLPLNCPVSPLGKLGKTFFFLNTLGEVHELTDSASGKGPIDALFAGRPLYLEWAWPRWAAPKRKGEPWSVKGYEADECRRDLFAACAYKGTFELEDRVRGRGAWRNDDGGLIYHAGDAVWIDGRWKPPGEHGRFIYPGRPKIGRPAERVEPEGEGSPGAILLEALDSWNWERKGLDSKLALGWLMTAFVGGALEQRPVAYVVGTEGAGKSTLQKLFRLLMNGALLATSNTTQAGIYQKVKQDSVAVLVDEMEAKSDTRLTDKILELARIAYSGDKMQRGGKDGVGQEFAVMSSFLMSSIAMPAVDAQDASRMAVLMLREREIPQPGEKAVDVLKELGLRDGAKAQAIGRQLLARAFSWFTMEGNRTRWERLLEAFREALKAAGHEDRSADTFGALAAGCHMALRDVMPDDSELKAWGEMLEARTLTETATREKTWRRCLTHALDAVPDALKHENLSSAGAVLSRFAEDGKFSLETVDKVLAKCGMALSWEQGAPPSFEYARLFVPAKSAALHGLFKDTPWAGRPGTPGPWIGVLRQMPRHLWENGKCLKGLDRKASGIFIYLAAALEA
ncbi:MAG TPA: hypothetical protein VEA44_16140 [Caulobacter sp.]|nr:hypothetical protein [Caulobacter sp.]